MTALRTHARAANGRAPCGQATDRFSREPTCLQCRHATALAKACAAHLARTWVEDGAEWRLP